MNFNRVSDGRNNNEFVYNANNNIVNLLGDSSDEEEEQKEMMWLLMYIIGVMRGYKRQPIFRMYSSRVNWAVHVELLEHSNNFRNTYGMEIQTFGQLVDLIRPMVTVDITKAWNSAPEADPIYPELVVAVGLRYLLGGRYQDIRDWAGISTASVFRCRDYFMEAILQSTALEINFPTEQRELDRIAEGFQNLSNPQGGMPIFTHCVGAIDGMLIRIRQPHDVPNPRAYYSGHYSCMGVNVQAVCDHRCRFTYIALAVPGSTPDIVAMNEVDLGGLIQEMDPWYHFVADNAYMLSEKVIIPYAGDQSQIEANDNFNYFLSQLRIRIEMTFGVYTTRFRIFRRPLEVSLVTLGKIIITTARLHNFIITTEQPEITNNNTHIDPFDGLATLDEAQRQQRFIPGEPNHGIIEIEGNSVRRDVIRNMVRDKRIVRPDQNVQRNAGGRN